MYNKNCAPACVRACCACVVLTHTGTGTRLKLLGVLFNSFSDSKFAIPGHHGGLLKVRRHDFLKFDSAVCCCIELRQPDTVSTHKLWGFVYV